MDIPYRVISSLLIGLCVSINPVWADDYMAPVRVNNFVIPPVFATALYQGMSVPVFIRYSGDTQTQRSRQKIADS